MASGRNQHQPPANVVAGKSISPAITVLAVDGYGNPVANTSIHLEVDSGPANLVGTVTVKTATNGVASFSGLSLKTAGSYTLIALNSGAVSSGA